MRRRLAVPAAISLLLMLSPVRMSAELPSTLAGAAAIGNAAVVTLKLPGRAALYGLLADDWPDEDDLFAVTNDDRTDGERTVGTAVVVEASGIAVTTARLGRRALALKAETADGRRLSAMVVGRDDQTNVAVLTLCCSARALPAIVLGDSDRVRAGDRVLASAHRSDSGPARRHRS
jgi:S1-C subfamily serine protease